MVSGFLFFFLSLSLDRAHFRSGQAFFGFFSMVVRWFILTHFSYSKKMCVKSDTNQTYEIGLIRRIPAQHMNLEHLFLLESMFQIKKSSRLHSHFFQLT